MGRVDAANVPISPALREAIREEVRAVLALWQSERLGSDE
jgi:hypothetical protein